MDTNDPETAHNVLRINQNGLGFSSTGVGGPYTQAWTLDGKMVIGGTNVPSITVYDNSSPPQILFQISASGMIWNAANSSMNAQGKLTATGAKLTNAEITNTGSDRYGIKIKSSSIAFTYNGSEKSTISFLTESGTRFMKLYDPEDIQLVVGTKDSYGRWPCQVELSSSGLLYLRFYDRNTRQYQSGYVAYDDQTGSLMLY